MVTKKKTSTKKPQKQALKPSIFNLLSESGEYSRNELSSFLSSLEEITKIGNLTLDFADKIILNQHVAPGDASKVLVCREKFEEAKSIVNEYQYKSGAEKIKMQAAYEAALRESAIWLALFNKYLIKYRSSGNPDSQIMEFAMKEKVTLWGELSAKGMFRAGQGEVGYIMALSKYFDAAFSQAGVDPQKTKM